MSTPTVLNASVSSIEAQLQRITEDFATHLEFEGGDPAVVVSGQEIVEQTKKRLVALRHEIEAIALDPDISDAKKTKLAVEAVRQAYTDLQSVRKAATTKADAANEAKARLTAVPKAASDPITDALINSEIRQRLAELPQSERMKLVSRAMTTGRLQVVRAIQLDPLDEEVVPAEFLRRLQEEHAQQTEGKAWTRQQSLQLVSDRLTMIAVALDLNLKGYGTIPVFERKTVRHVDLKQMNPHTPPDKGPADEPPAGGVPFQ